MFVTQHSIRHNNDYTHLRNNKQKSFKLTPATKTLVYTETNTILKQSIKMKSLKCNKNPRKKLIAHTKNVQ